MDDDAELEACDRFGICRERDRWYCQSLVDWEVSKGRSVWGDDGDEGARLRYLAAASATELAWLAQMAHDNLDSGGWEGFKSPNGGFLDGPPLSEKDIQWWAAAADFMERYERGEMWLTEGMLRHASWDLCRELTWYRRWCPYAIRYG
jgi:hypothetical protein